ncbi:MAG: hypothetical protein AMS22_09930 [Thiotrichales bacterium SG8_50]|jgi:biofilm PGA synthesis N-glycosyltransferase PgaC|nr:MAG: hypothetical protein AMS22_09930 [Thiotrichales bacterium SG8_50]
MGIMAELLFWGGLLLMFYTYVGYPVAIWTVARLRPRRTQSADFTPPVTIVIVAYNAETQIARKLRNCLTLDYPADSLNILVASDGSTDGTSKCVRDFAASGVRLLDFTERRGKAACLNDALHACQTEFTVMTDVRQRLAPDAVRALLRNFNDDAVGAVSGEMVFEDSSGSGFEKGIDAYWRYEKFIRYWEGVADSVVGVTGAIYALRRSSFQPLPEGTILDDVLIPMNVVLQGKRVVFEPSALAYDVPETDAAGEGRRKKRTLAGNYQLLALRPAILNPFRNRIWWQLVSHKLTRLVAPLAMLVVFLANLVLAMSSNFYTTLFATQIVLYSLALTGVGLPQYQRSAAIRIPATFFTFNWYAVLGFVEYLRNRRSGGHLWR